MKRFIFIVTVMLSAVAMVSCGKDDKTKKDAGNKDIDNQDIEAYEIDMGHPGNGKTITSNMVGGVSGTDWYYELWHEDGMASLTVWSNGTFKATWSNSKDFLARVGYRYNDGSPVSHIGKNFAADFNYDKSGSGGTFSYIGAYGWTVQPLVEWFIVDDWFGSEPFIPKWYKEMGSYVVDGEEYTIYVRGAIQQPSITAVSDFIRVWSVRKTKRQRGHMSLQTHFEKFNTVFHGQTESIPVSENSSRSFTTQWGKLLEVRLGLEIGSGGIGSGGIGSIEYNHFNVTENQQ